MQADPLLAAVLGSTATRRDQALCALLAGARRQRRARAIRHWALAAAVPLLSLGAAWGLFRSAGVGTVAAASRTYTLVCTSEQPDLARVNTLGDLAMLVRSRGDGLRIVSTADDDSPLEIAPTEGALLAMLPDGTGFIGKPGARQFVWLSAVPLEAEPAP
jgi:hypothetical protein